ncbi:MAG: tRNA nucleotidyltransferase/poly(A) polymerase family protein [Solirubrobacteraceae bacterium]
MSERIDNGETVLGGLRELPGGHELLALAQRRADVELVGGAVRDLLLGRRPRELDVIVEAGAPAFARELADFLDGRLSALGVRSEVETHERFGTAAVRFGGGRVDVAARRAESYAAPGALPDVRTGTPQEDLLRRDFTVNAIAVALGGDRRGELREAPHALEDLRAARLRVLHDGSFRDDPTRMLRMARYEARLGFAPDEHTAALAGQAIAAGALDTVSPARIGAELRLALGEPDAVAALEAMQRLGVLSALHEAIELDAPLARAALGALPDEEGNAWPDVLLLASLLMPARAYDAHDYETRLRVLLDRYEFPAAERERAVHSALVAPRLAERLRHAETPSQIYAIAHDAALEAVALAEALAAARGEPQAAEAARLWLSQLRKVSLEIDGEDLLSRGIPAGPEVGRRLRGALMRKLDGELADVPEVRDAELSAALEAQ